MADAHSGGFGFLAKGEAMLLYIYYNMPTSNWYEYKIFDVQFCFDYRIDINFCRKKQLPLHLNLLSNLFHFKLIEWRQFVLSKNKIQNVYGGRHGLYVPP